jgi:hypothetical protein
MRRAIIFRSLLGMALWSTGVLSIRAVAAQQDDVIYRALVDAAKAGDSSVDYRLMRLACMKSSLCQPRSSKAELQALTDAEKDPRKLVEIGERLLDEGFVNIEVHATLAAGYAKLGETKKADFHLSMVASMLQSIQKSGDGKTAATAYEVICNREEYGFLSFLHLPYTGDGVVSAKPVSEGRHKYSRWEVRDPKSGQVRVVFFNVDAFTDEKSLPR